eukprot:CAMPEP_0185189618 /NCGR_PEP_ID=MMETSP1140-20130426/6149_1 /TAXON_ID=298111 /ORGANISM="Pavlova sp., Strain CCMP459" /LENGTH=412 /DNA_ID=CAMNT_0027756195 /DNA_START=8 /DNA_END=1246 /DNA_ORIENTATION=+
MATPAQSEARGRNLPQQLTLEHVSPATRLLEKRRQMFEVQEALDAQKEEYKRREAEFKRREEKLKERDLALQESLIKFNKFLQENDSKRARAEKKEKDEMKQRLAKEAEIARLRETLEKLKQDKAEMQAVVAKDMRYQQYLDSVVEVNDREFPDIAEILMRYDTLDATHNDLVERSRLGQAQLEEQAIRNAKYAKEMSDETLANNNEIANLQQRLEVVQGITQRLQMETERRLQDAAEVTLQLGQVLMACDNIYTRCVRSSHVKRKDMLQDADDKDAAIDKLNSIGDYVGDLLFITKNYTPPEARGGGEAGATPAGSAANLADAGAMGSAGALGGGAGAGLPRGSAPPSTAQSGSVAAKAGRRSGKLSATSSVMASGVIVTQPSQTSQGGGSGSAVLSSRADSHVVSASHGE